ncbi:MAG: T9SS type A sorting domain-containing protein [Bacteroidetes bacterium]|nr:T9SS type A sorting domain-containing protein [Bacteroidota bacterium]
MVTYNLKDNADNVTINVYDVIGQKVRTLAKEPQKAGVHKINWNGDNDKGTLLKNGLYFYTLEINGSVLRTNRLVISR